MPNYRKSTKKIQESELVEGEKNTLFIKGFTANHLIEKLHSLTTDILYVTGPSSTGKTTMVKKFQETHYKYHQYFDCSRITSPTEIYSGVLRCLSKASTDCHSSTNFVQMFHQLITEKRITNLSIALDDVHRLKDNQVIPLIMHLDEIRSVYCKDPFFMKLILVSPESLDRFASSFKNQVSMPGKLHKRCHVFEVPPWSKKDLIERITSGCECPQPDLFRTMVNNIVSTHYSIKTKDYIELNNICLDAFARFMEECSDGEEFESGSHTKMSSQTCDRFLKAFKKTQNLDQTDCKVVYDMLVLITASYIASFTTPKDDKINFVKFNSKSKSRPRKLDTPRQGAKSFTLERLLQIYRHLRDTSIHERLDNPKRDDLLDSVIANTKILVDLNFLRTEGPDGLSSLNKYTIADRLDYKYAKLIAKGCDVALDDYLT